MITGRVADPALVLGPLVYEFGWSMEDGALLGKGTIAGHLLECAGQVTGVISVIPAGRTCQTCGIWAFPLLR